jgi:predicted ATPase
MQLDPSPRARRARALDVAAPEEFARQVADALSHLHDLARLQTHPLAERLVEGGRSSDGLGRALEQLLLDAIEALQPTHHGTSERSGRTHRLLVLRHVQGLEPSAVWVQLGIGKSEYYREHSHGLDALASLLWQKTRETDSKLLAANLAHQRLAQPLTSFVGRDREIGEVQALMQHARIVTLTGPPGSGKTRLALQIADRTPLPLVSRVVFVGLAPLTEPKNVLPAVAQALGLPERPGRAVLDQIVDAVSDGEQLLVLDNFEHVIAAAPELALLMGTCPRLRVLVTSRERLRISGEHAYGVTPLNRSDAVQLFVQRAQASRADLVLTPADANSVDAICARVDRLPLAIELAASRVRVFEPTALLTRLERRLPLLSGGPRDQAPRQQALRATIAWSYDLLDSREQALFRTLAVFVGGCTLEAIRAVCGDDSLEGVTSLVEKSLLYQESGLGGEPRFWMLETIREFSLERLDASGVAPVARRAHADYFRLVAEQAEAEYLGPMDGEVLDMLDQEYANLRAAIEWALDGGDLEVGLALGGALWRFLFHRDHLSDGRDVLHRLLAAAPPADIAAPSSALAKALFCVSSLAVWQGESPAGRADAETSVALYRALGDKRGEGRALHTLAHTASNHTTERNEYAASVARLREAGDMLGLAWSLQCLGNVKLELGDLNGAREAHTEALSLSRQSNSVSGLAGALTGLGNLAVRQGDPVRAYELFVEGFELRRKDSDRALTDQLNVLGRAALGMGDLSLAAVHFSESLELCRKQGIKWDAAFALDGVATVEMRRGDARQAATLFGAADTLLESIDARRSANDQAEHARILETLTEALGDKTFQRASAAGRAMGLTEAIDCALGRRVPP